jgi:transaldolase
MGIGGSRLFDLQTLGQRVWLECNHPRMLAHSRLAHLIRAGISGIDSNPDSQAAAFADDAAYREPIAELRAAGATMRHMYEQLRIEDARHMADCLRRVYDTTGRRDGYSNIDVSPAVADDAVGIESEARRLWADINRPNVMIKVPATDAGLLALRPCIAAGLNINATEIFGVRRYAAVNEAYLLGLQDRLAAGMPLESVASVASIMVGRIDAAVDDELQAIAKPAKAAIAKRLRGRAALAIAQFAYQHYKSVLSSPRWRLLAAYHAQTQRLLWGGTEISAADDGDLTYVHELTGRDTVTAMSLSTVDAYLDHGAAAPTLERNLLEVVALFGELETVGVDLDRVSMQLERERTTAMAASVNTALTRLLRVAREVH